MRQAVAEVVPGTRRLPEDPAVRLAFSDRSAGNVSLQVGGGDVARARGGLAARVGVPPAHAVYMEQVHGAGVAEVGTRDRGRGLHRPGEAVRGVDALVTRDVGVALVVLVADCVPVLVVDPGRAVAAVHAGRRGIAEGVVPACVETIGEDPAHLVAVLGPAIGPCCYEVPAELADAVAEVVPVARAQTRWGSPSLDLHAAVVDQLARAGVGTVRATAGCTRCRGDRWFSHRGDAPADRGRQAGIVCRLGAPQARGRLTGSGTGGA
ncbi:MAG: polyphenol oxidase family protein [Egibacteraceae bacterium]